MVWNFDPAASGDRWRAFATPYELGAYEDGRWYVCRDGDSIAAGTSLSLKHAKQIASLVYEFTLKVD